MGGQGTSPDFCLRPASSQECTPQSYFSFLLFPPSGLKGGFASLLGGVLKNTTSRMEKESEKGEGREEDRERERESQGKEGEERGR